MENKVSEYNIEVDYCNGVLLYNTLTNKLLPVSFEDYTVIGTLMEHLPEFEVKFPGLYQAFLKSGFIVPFDFDELAYIKLQNKRGVFMNPCEHKVQYYETDGMGIVHHSNYIRWFEEARVDLLEQLGFGYDRIEAAGYSGPVLEVSCQYKTMSKFGETVRIEASITQYNGVRMTLHYDVYDKATGTLRCTGDSRHCFINAEGKPAILKRCWPEFDAALAANTVKE